MPPLPPLTEPVRFEHRGAVPNDRLYLAFRLPADGTTDFLAAGLALDILGGLSSSRMVERLVRTETIATGLSAHPMGLAGGVSLGIISVDVLDEVDPAVVERAICEELDRFAAHGPTEEELEAAVAETERSWLSALAGQDERADQISHYAALYDDPGYLNSFLDQVRAVTAAQIHEAATAYLLPQQRAVVAYLVEPDAGGSESPGDLTSVQAGVAQ